MWPTTEAGLVAAQRRLASAPPAPPALSAPLAADMAVGACVVLSGRGQSGPGAAGDRCWAGAAVWRGDHAIAEATVTGRAGAPYAAGLLALREGPVLEAVVRALPVIPDVLLVDATGRDHPRRAGLALHLGAELGLATVGVTHRPLLASGAWPEDRVGAMAPLQLDGVVVGAWLRTRPGARPLAVHAAWRTDVDLAVEIVRLAAMGVRTPEPLRHARRLARLARAADRGGVACRLDGASSQATHEGEFHGRKRRG